MEVTRIFLAKYSDAKEISLLSRKLIEFELPTTRYTEYKVKDAIRHDSKNVVVAKNGERLTGMGIMTYLDDSANLDLLAVVPEHQGTGLAKDIVSWLENVALNAGIFKIQVQARARNHKGIQFYEKLGYEIFKNVPRVYGVETQVRMAKILCS
jgi:ribosomal-protein-alanine N-acetyltransferase